MRSPAAQQGLSPASIVFKKRSNHSCTKGPPGPLRVHPGGGLTSLGYGARTGGFAHACSLPVAYIAPATGWCGTLCTGKSKG